MPVIYNKVAKYLPGKNGQKKYYVALKTVNMVREKDVAKLLSEETTLNRKEAEMALAQFQKILARELLNSKSVQLGDWGSFSLSCSSVGHETLEGVNAHSIKSLRIRFTPGKELKEALSRAEFIPAESLLGRSGGKQGNGDTGNGNGNGDGSGIE